MDPEQQGVTPDSPTDPEPDESQATAAAVSAVDLDANVGDRPARNILAELERKQRQQFDAFKAEILSALRPQPPAAPPQSREYSDEELSQLAAAGDSRAHLELSRRVAARTTAEQLQAQSQVQATLQQRQVLYAKYPVLADTSHPLTQYAMQAKAILIQSGRANDASVDVDAIRTAIADLPDVAAQVMVRQPTPASVPRATVPTAAASAPAPRRTPAATQQQGISDKQWALAKRMGFTSREKAAQAITNMERRQKDGQSTFGNVAAFIREDQ